MGAWDMTIQVAPVCETVKNFSVKFISSDGQRQYTAVFGPTPYGRYQHDWECDCMGFKTRKSCKHIDLAKQKRCGWNAHLEPYPMPEDRKCPDCGGELEFVKVAV